MLNNNGSSQENGASVALPQVAIPKGGGAVHQVIEKFAAHAATGAGQYTLPLPISSGRQGFHPGLQLSYSSSAGNGSFGLGWQLNLASVKRKTQKQLPTYKNDVDVFIWSDAEDLVPVSEENHEDYLVTTYQPRVEGSFAQIQMYEERATGKSFWKILTADNVTHFYGRSPVSRIHHPDNENQVFEWLIEESRDAFGNIIKYEYRLEDFVNVPKTIFEEGRDVNNCINRYLHKICYGNKVPNEADNWLFQLVFCYGRHIDEGSESALTNDWDCRKDTFSTYRAGFEIRNYRLCHQVLMHHHFDELGAGPVLVRSLDLDYRESTAVTLLHQAKITGYGKEEDRERSSSSPIISFDYTKAELDSQIHKVETGSQENWPGGLANANHHWVDLEGEGLSGILTETENSWYYKPNLGGGNFGPQHELASIPGLSSTNSRPVLIDLNQDGRKEFVIAHSGVGGYYSREGFDWTGFESFAYPLSDNFATRDQTYLDLNGNGLADVLVDTGDEFLIHYARGKSGYNPAVAQEKRLGEQLQLGQTGNEQLHFSDMTGDGLQDLVKVSATHISYWPALGYGKFGSKVVMDNPPLLDVDDEFEPEAVQLVDIDGSGPSDLIYLKGSIVRYWYNQAGNSWSEPKLLRQLPPKGQFAKLSVIDFLGDGTACLVWSGSQPGNEDQVNYLRLTGGIKPFLLSSIDNGTGMISSIEYKPSTYFYLEDKKAERPLITQIPFPVHVVAQMETQDLISHSKLTTHYRYHHGFYDGVEKEFRGFGFVEQWDSEFFEQYTGDLNDSHFAHPICTKRWFHTGAYLNEQMISQQYKKEYYQGDSDAYSLLDSKIIGDTRDYELCREAHRALAGSLLREEVYAADNDPLSHHPYLVSETNFTVKTIKRPEGEVSGIYHPLQSEEISYHYERNGIDDPRVQHGITLKTDEFGNVTASAEVVYARRRSGDREVIPEQLELITTLVKSRFINQTEGFRRLGVPIENQSFVIPDLVPSNTYFNAEELRESVDVAIAEPTLLGNPIVSRNACLASWEKQYYWDVQSQEALPLGEINPTGLLHMSSEVVFPEGYVEQIFEGRVNRDTLQIQGFEVADEHWWRESPKVFYQEAQHFFQPAYSEDFQGNRSRVSYDSYDLLPLQAEDALGNITVTEIDYHIFQPFRVTNPNENVSEFKYDLLGELLAVSTYGKEGEAAKGDRSLREYTLPDELSFERIEESPHEFLQGATSFSFLDRHAWSEKGEPLQTINLTRTRHVSELADGEQSDIEIQISYIDGFGRALQSKAKVEPGPAFLRGADGLLIKDEEGNLSTGHAEKRWLVSGRTIYNNKEKPIRQYEPFYSSLATFETEAELGQYGVSPLIHYDPLGRVIKVDSPDGFFSEVRFSAWEIQSFDQNDTIERSERYQLNRDAERRTISPEEWQALEASLLHKNTPTIASLDTLGRTVRTTVYQENDTPLTSIDTYDIYGNLSQQTDPRQLQFNQVRGADGQLANFTYRYDMSGSLLKTSSLDAGEKWQLQNALGLPTLSFNSRGFVTEIQYDPIYRPLTVHVSGEGLNHQVQKLEYGEGEPDAAANNLRGQLIRHYDESGLMEVQQVDFKGNVLKAERRLRKNYKTEANWRETDDDLLEEETFEASSQLDALNRPLRSLQADGSRTDFAYALSGRLNGLRVSKEGETQQVVTNITYNAKNQREEIQFGNGIRKNYTYDPLTFRLKSLDAVRIEDGKQLQDLAYTYDPVGNISQIVDASHERVFNDNQQVDPVHRYTYDALYQLKTATGRCHSGVSRSSHKDGFKQSAFRALENSASPNDLQQLSNYIRNYRYDIAGNLLQINHLGPNAFTRNIIISQRSNHGVEDAENPIDPEHFFDANGNLKQLDHLREIQWNYRDNIAHATLIERENQVSDAEYYVYDAAGKRVRKVAEYLENDGSRIRIEEKIYMGAVEIKRTRFDQRIVKEQITLQISDNEKRIATLYQNTIGEANEPNQFIRYELCNHLGSSSLTLDGRGRLVTYEEYFPYGGSAFVAGINRAEVSRKVYRYSGKERDDSTGLYYYGFRYYAPWMGRWLSADPAGTVDGLNLYQFVRGNPIKLKDEKGLNSDFINDIKVIHVLEGAEIEEMANESYHKHEGERAKEQKGFHERIAKKYKKSDPALSEKHAERAREFRELVDEHMTKKKEAQGRLKGIRKNLEKRRKSVSKLYRELNKKDPSKASKLMELETEVKNQLELDDHNKEVAKRDKSSKPKKPDSSGAAKSKVTSKVKGGGSLMSIAGQFALGFAFEPIEEDMTAVDNRAYAVIKKLRREKRLPTEDEQKLIDQASFEHDGYDDDGRPIYSRTGMGMVRQGVRVFIIAPGKYSDMLMESIQSMDSNPNGVY